MREKEKEKSNQTKNYLQRLMQQTKKVVDLVVGNADDYTDEDSGGDLPFDPRLMMKLRVSFDKDHLPQEKAVKFNLRGTRFFNEIKFNLREINCLFIVYPNVYAIQLDHRKDEWEQKLIRELNADYGLELKSIRFFNEEDIAGQYQRVGIAGIRHPYRLNEGELLLIAGGFTNFNFNGVSICRIHADISVSHGDQTAKHTYTGNYFTRYSEKAGAYFYAGSEWYHNLFIPEFFLSHAEPFFFSLRLADDGKNLKFFSSPDRSGIDIRGDAKTEMSETQETITHTINPEYLTGSNVNECLLTAIYDIEEKDHAPTVQFNPINGKKEIVGDANEHTPFLEDAMILLPAPNSDDIPSYMMKIGDEKKGINFFASSVENEISITASGNESDIYKRAIKESIDYSIRFGSARYSVSNRFLTRFNDKELKIYFSWILSSNMVNRIPLTKGIYVFGREPVPDTHPEDIEKIKPYFIQLNEGTHNFWRIGVSRTHAAMVKGPRGKFRLYNISSSFPVYTVREEDLGKSMIAPFRLEPATDIRQRENVQAILTDIKKGRTDPMILTKRLRECAENLELEMNDLIIIGNRGFKFITPLVMESELSPRVQMSVTRKIRESTLAYRSD
ncbi:MAG: hypothetical protein ACM3SY_05000 [Candidatus Omnitrophota bacterium]